MSLRLTNEQKAERQLRRLVKAFPDTPIQDYCNGRGVTLKVGRYVGEFFMFNGGDYWCHNFHIRHEDDHSDIYTDYFAGFFVDNMKQFIDTLTDWRNK